MWWRVCRSGLLVGFLAVTLAGCDEGVGFGLQPAGATGGGIRTLALLGGDARARGPSAYCVDQRASRARTGFAVLAGCALLSEQAAVMPALSGLLTVQFGPAGTASVSGNEEAFAGFIASEEGRSILARDGNSANIGQVTATVQGGRVLAWFEDRSGPAMAGTSGPQWRGFVDIGGRLVTVTVLSFDHAPLSRAEGQRLLVLTMAELVEANAPAPNETSGDA